ncbi:MAG: serine hydrolase [Chitinophaga sp.]|nr:serine hydrolase [Chitinophaga sp.]
MNLIKVSPLFLLLLFVHFGNAQSNSSKINKNNSLKRNIESIIHKYAAEFLTNPSRVGLSLGIYHNKSTSTFHYGSTEKEQTVIPSNKTVYEIGSISKTFTGTLLAQAVKDKKVKIDDDIRLYLDGSYPNLEYQGHPIRLSHLVSHISGLPNFLPDDPDLFQKTSPDSLPFVLSRTLNNYSKKRFLDDVHKVKIDTIPGYKFRYSNSSPLILKYILEKVYQNNFDEILQKFIYKDLKMKNTTSVFNKINLNHLAKGYNSKGNLMPYIPENLDAAGGLFSTIPDMLKYLKFHLNENDEVIALSHKATMGDIKNYAIGLNWQEVITTKGHKKIWQSGGTFGFSSYCVLYPDLDFAIVLLTNEADNTAQTELGQIADKLFDYINKH